MSEYDAFKRLLARHMTFRAVGSVLHVGTKLRFGPALKTAGILPKPTRPALQTPPQKRTQSPSANERSL